MGKRVHVDILFTATTITVLFQILFQTGGQIGIKAMPEIFSPPGFLGFFIPLSVHMVRPTNPAYGYETTETIFFLEKKPCLCATKRSFLF